MCVILNPLTKFVADLLPMVKQQVDFREVLKSSEALFSPKPGPQKGAFAGWDARDLAFRDAFPSHRS